MFREDVKSLLYPVKKAKLFQPETLILPIPKDPLLKKTNSFFLLPLFYPFPQAHHRFVSNPKPRE